MSIQDESFPYDEEIEFSRESAKNYVFPHYERRRNNIVSDENREACELSSSSPLENPSDCTQSSSETSGKTNASEPNNLQGSNKESKFIRNNPNKSFSYQDIHSEYTKRRYKHIESKVGQFIANVKAQAKKRHHPNFYRHNSMPETLHGSRETTSVDNDDPKKLGLLRRSTNDLNRMDTHHNDFRSDQDIYNYDNLMTSTLSTKDSVSENGIFLDKQTYEQMLKTVKRSEYLETRLEEKNAENWRIKQNLETIRIEYSLFMDKVKQQTQVHRFSGSFGNINGAAMLEKSSLQNLLYSQETREKFTQTDRILTPSSIPTEGKSDLDMFATPLTPDSNNNTYDHAAVGMLAPIVHKVSKSIATIQPISLNFSNLVDQDLNNSDTNTTMSFLRQRSNSLVTRKKSTPLRANISKTSSAGSSIHNSTDSAIDIEVAESPKTQRQSRREEFVYFQQCSERCAFVNSGEKYLNTTNNSNANSSMTDGGLKNNVARHQRKRRNLRTRVMRLFGACMKCEDPNITSEIHDSQQSQIPLLEKSTLNFCHNIR